MSAAPPRSLMVASTGVAGELEPCVAIRIDLTSSVEPPNLSHCRWMLSLSLRRRTIASGGRQPAPPLRVGGRAPPLAVEQIRAAASRSYYSSHVAGGASSLRSLTTDAFVPPQENEGVGEALAGASPEPWRAFVRPHLSDSHHSAHVASGVPQLHPLSAYAFDEAALRFEGVGEASTNASPETCGGGRPLSP